MEMTPWNESDKAVQEKKRETIKALSNVTTGYSSKAKAPPEPTWFLLRRWTLHGLDLKMPLAWLELLPMQSRRHPPTRVYFLRGSDRMSQNGLEPKTLIR